VLGLLERVLARLTGIPAELIIERRLDDTLHGERLAVRLAAMAEFSPRLHFLTPPFAWPNIVAGLQATKPQILLLDYLQRIAPPADCENTRAAVAASMDCARRIADAGVAVLALSAVGRVGDGKVKYSGLGLGSFRESSDIECGADDAFILSRDRPEDETALTLKHVKCRRGKPIDLPLRFRGDVLSFTVGDAQSNPALGEAIRNVWQASGTANGDQR